MSTGELACTYACLILHDDSIAISSEKIATLLKAANVNIESYWASLFAKLCEKKDIDDLIINVGIGGGGAVGDSTTASGGGADAAPATLAVEEKKEELKEESDDDNMFGLFD